MVAAPLWARAEDYAIDWFSVDSGGGTSADGVYEVSGTIGQPDAGELGDDVYTVSGGFWAAAIDTEPLRPPTLKFAVVGNALVLSWPVTPGYVLEQTMDLSQPDGWHAVGQPIVVVNGQNTVTVPLAGTQVYYRLTDTPSSTVPRLKLVRVGGKGIVSWPAWADGYFLEENLNPTLARSWTHVGLPAAISGDRRVVTLPMDASHVFFRLTRAPVVPSLNITLVGGSFVITWPAPATGYHLERNLEIAQPDGWSLSDRPVVVTNGLNVVTVPVGEMAFYRLTSEPAPLVLRLTSVGPDVVLSWPASASAYFLEATADESLGGRWSLVNAPVVVVNGLSTVRLPASGSLQLFRLTRLPGPPSLEITLAGTSIVLSWPEVYRGYFLEQNPDATQSGDWSYVNRPVATTNRHHTVTLPIMEGGMYFRLVQTPHGPALSIELTDLATARVSWSVNSSGFVLQENIPAGSSIWQDVAAVPATAGYRKQVIVPAATPGALFRLKLQ